MLKLILGDAGSGKSFRLMKNISDAVDNADLDSEKIIAICPEQFSSEFEKKLYRELGMIKSNKIMICSFSKLSDIILNTCGCGGGNYVEDTTKSALMYLAVKKARGKEKLGFYGSRAGSGGFINSVAEVIDELRSAAVSPEDIMSKDFGGSDSTSKKMSDIAEIYLEYSELLRERGLSDRKNVISEAAGCAAKFGFFKGAKVFLDEFKSFTADQIMLIRTMLSSAELVEIALTAPKLTGDKRSVFAAVNDAYFKLELAARECNCRITREILQEQPRFKSSDFLHVSSCLGSNTEVRINSKGGITLIEAADIYREAEYIAAKVRQLVSEQGYRYGEIAVVSRILSEYSGALEGAFERYEIPCFIDEKKSVSYQAVMSAVSLVLEAVSEDKFDTEVLLRLAKSGMVRLTMREINELENFCYKWGVDGDTWLSPFISAENQGDRNEGADGDGFSSEYQAEQARLKLIAPLRELKNSPHNGGELCTRLYKCLRVLGMNRAVYGLGRNILDAEAAEAANSQKLLWNELMTVLDRLYSALENVELTPAELYTIFGIVIQNKEAALPPQQLDAVLVTGAERGRLSSPRVVFIAGANDTIFPCDAKEDGLLSEKDRQRLASDFRIVLSKNLERMTAEERFTVYNTICAPSDLLFVSYALSDLTGKNRFASSVIGRINDLFEEELLIAAESLPLTFYASTKKAAYYIYVRQLHNNDSETAALREALMKYPEYAERIKRLSEINSDFDYKISKENIKRLNGDKWYLSPTKFEEFCNCRFRYFCNHVLSLKPPERIKIDGKYKGMIAHYCYERLLTENSKEEIEKLSEDKALLGRTIEGYMKDYLDIELGGEYSKTKRFMLAFRRLKTVILNAAEHIAKEICQSEFVPADFELKFNSSESKNKLIADDGTEIVFNGIVDRVDVYEHEGVKYIRIVDYKTGSFDFSVGELYYGIHVQTILYLSRLAAEGKYEGYEGAGSLYMTVGEIDMENDVGREQTEEEINTAKSEHYKMNGILLNDNTVLTAMDKQAEENAVYIKISRKDGSSSIRNCFTKDAMERLHKYTEQMIKEAAIGLYSGDISAAPLIAGNEEGLCPFCEYYTICGNYPNVVVRDKDKKLAVARMKEALGLEAAERSAENKNSEKKRAIEAATQKEENNG